MSNRSLWMVVIAGGLVAALAPGGFAQCPMEWSPGFAARGLDGPVYAQAVFDDGRGPALYVGGRFEKAGGVPAKSIAKWDGARWSAVGGGLPDPYTPAVADLCVHDDGTGRRLYVAGLFTHAGGIPVSNIVSWDGQAWSPLGAGTNRYAIALLSTNIGGVPVLLVGGAFTLAGGQPAVAIARWQSGRWHSFVERPNEGVLSFAQAPGSGSPVFYVGGAFTRAGPHASARIGRWACVPGWVPGDLNCDGVVDYRDVDPFVWAVIDRAQFEARFPGCLWFNGDINADNRVDFGDINPFVRLLTQP